MYTVLYWDHFLFLIYMNDIPNSCQAFRFVLYTDDTTLFSTIEYILHIDSSHVNYLLNRELSLVYEWLFLNKLSLDIKKTKFMLFHPYQKDVSNLVPVLKINQNEIERVDTFDFLGVTLDEHVNWKAHTDKLATRLSKYSGILNKLKNYLPPYILRTLYCSLVQSHLSYAILTWGYSCNPYNITKQIQCTYRTTFKTIRATEIVRSVRIKCLEVLFQNVTIIKLLNVISRVPIIHLLLIYFCTNSWNARAAICLEGRLSLLALSSVYSLTVEDGSWSTPMVPAQLSVPLQQVEE